MRLIALLFLVLMGYLGYSQEKSKEWDTFREKVRPYYYYLMDTSIQNFSCLISTQNYINFIKNKGDTVNVYPVKFIWTRSGKLYYILQPYPGMENSTERPKVLEKIQLLKNQFHGFYLDWLNFLINSPLDDVPPETEIVRKGDSIFVSYISEDNGMEAVVRKIFLLSGRLILMEVESSNEKVVNYPFYKEVNGKWVCGALNTQIYVNDAVSSGLHTQMELRKIEDQWFPIRVDVIVQSVEKPNEKFISTIYMKAYEFNLPLHELESPQVQDSSSQAIPP